MVDRTDPGFSPTAWRPDSFREQLNARPVYLQPVLRQRLDIAAV